MPFTTYHLPFTIYHLPFIIYHLPFTICHLPFTIYHLPFTIFHLPFTIYHLSFTIYHLPYTIYHLPFTIYHLSFTIYTRNIQEKLTVQVPSKLTFLPSSPLSGVRSELFRTCFSKFAPWRRGELGKTSSHTKFRRNGGILDTLLDWEFLLQSVHIRWCRQE